MFPPQHDLTISGGRAGIFEPMRTVWVTVQDKTVSITSSIAGGYYRQTL